MNDRSKACLQVFLSWAKFSVLHNERGQQVDENDINNFFQKTFWSKWTILGPKMVYIHNSRSAVRIRWVTHLSMSLFPSFHLPVCLSVCPSICRTPYLKNRTSSNHNFWYTCVKWYLQVCFSFCWDVDFSGYSGGKRAKNVAKWKIIISVTHHISGTVKHMIMIFGTLVLNDDIFRCFFHFLGC